MGRRRFRIIIHVLEHRRPMVWSHSPKIQSQGDFYCCILRHCFPQTTLVVCREREFGHTIGVMMMYRSTRPQYDRSLWRGRKFVSRTLASVARAATTGIEPFFDFKALFLPSVGPLPDEHVSGSGG